MGIKLVTQGKEKGIVWAMAWLDRQGIPASMIRSVTVAAESGKPMTITPTIIVPDPDEDLATP